MDIGKAFSYVFDDPDWIKKVLFGALASIIPFFIIGYSLEVARNVANGVERPLPDWSGRWGEFFVSGLKAFVVVLVWTLPVSILGGILFCVALLPLMAASANPDGPSDSAAAAAAMSGGAAVFCLVPILLVVGLILAMPTYAALARLARGGTIGDALKFGEIIGQVRANWKPWASVIGVGFLVGLAVGLISQVTFGLGGIILGGYAQMVTGHAFGQAMRRTGQVDAVGSVPFQSF